MHKMFVAIVLAVLLCASSMHAGGLTLGVYGGPRFNSGSGEAYEDMESSLTTATQFAAGAFALLPLSTQFSLELGLGYTQRGMAMESSTTIGNQTFESSGTTAFNYVDLNIGLAWFFFGADSGQSALQPYIGVMVVPGFFMSGTTSVTSNGNTTDADVESDDVEAIHFAVRPNAGADFWVADGILIGLNVGYELGLTNVNKAAEGTEGDVPSAMWNGITTALRVGFSL